MADPINQKDIAGSTEVNRGAEGAGEARTPRIDMVQGVKEALKKGVKWVLEIFASSETKKSAENAIKFANGTAAREANNVTPLFKDHDYTEGIHAASHQEAA